MNTDELLHLLRERLRLACERIEENTLENPLRNNYLFAAGALVALRSERDFLTYLIDGLENESTALYNEVVNKTPHETNRR